MASLADLAPLSETVRVRGNDFIVNPLELATIAMLLAKYPAFAGIGGSTASSVHDEAPPKDRGSDRLG